MRDAKDAARYVLHFCTEEGTPVNPWQLQKILYCLQTAFYTAFSAPCFDDDFEAWACGPVVPSVYFAYGTAGASALTLREAPPEALFTAEEKKTADAVIRKAASLRPWYLEQAVRKDGHAWALTWRDGAGDRTVIPKVRIQTEG